MNNKNIDKPWNGKCPNCKDEYSYHGFLEVECVNVYCKFYNQKYHSEVQDYKNKIANELLTGLSHYDTNNQDVCDIDHDIDQTDCNCQDDQFNDPFGCVCGAIP